MHLEARAFKEVLKVCVDLPSPSVIARGHADGNQGDWQLVAGAGEVVGGPPPDLLRDEPPDSPIFGRN